MSAPLAALLTTRDRLAIPLLRVSARGRAEGLVLELTVEQHYRNTTAETLEAIYTFPLPVRAVLLGLEMDLNGARQRAVALGRTEAESNYERAIDEGHSAALLEHDGNGLYTMSVGNLKPGDEAVLRYRYAEILDAHEQHVRITIPGVIAPRYGDPADAGLTGHTVPHTDVLAEYPFDLSLDLVGITDQGSVHSPSHPLTLQPSERGLSVQLARRAYLDKDFVLELNRAAGSAKTLVAQDGESYVALASAALASDAREQQPLVLKLLLDCSGSMQGESITAAKRALLRIYDQLRPDDFLSLTRFGSKLQHVTEGLEPADAETLEPLRLLTRRMEADLGGTEMLQALEATLKIPHRGEAGADLVLVTDGLIEALAPLARLAAASRHRLFVIAIGASPNEALARTLTETTGGACEFVAAGEEAEAAIVRTFKRLRANPRKVAAIYWPATPAWSAPPPAAVFPGDTLHVFAGFTREPAGATQLVVEDSGRSTTLEVARATTLTPGDLLPRLAAARRLAMLPESTARELALKYQLVSRWTSFVLIAERAATDTATALPKTVVVPQMAPDESFSVMGLPPAGRRVSLGFDLSGGKEARRRAASPLKLLGDVPSQVPHETITRICLPDSPQELRALLASLAEADRHGKAPPTTLAELMANHPVPQSLAETLRTLAARSGVAEDVLVAILMALLAETYADALDPSLRKHLAGSFVFQRRHRQLRRELRAALTQTSEA